MPLRALPTQEGGSALRIFGSYRHREGHEMGRDEVEWGEEVVDEHATTLSISLAAH